MRFTESEERSNPKLRSPWARYGGLSPLEIIRLREQYQPTKSDAPIFMCIGSRPDSVTLFIRAYSAEHALFLAKTFMREVYSSAVVAKPEHLAWAKCNNHRIMVDRKLP